MNKVPFGEPSVPRSEAAGTQLPPSADAASASPTIPDHELLRLIGRGAYGEVWMARNAIGTLRAVKIVHRRSFQRAEQFEREFKGLLKFEPISRSQDGLVDVLQIGRRDDAGYFFYVMELADAAKSGVEDGGLKMEDGEDSKRGASHSPFSILDLQNYEPRTLRSELRARNRLQTAECVTLGLKLASALEHLHENGLVHRDIKPSNIIFVKGEPKLADIGLVTAIDEAQSLVGTVGYIPPEGPGTAKADLYSLGKVLYEIALGKDRHEFPQLPPDLQSHPDYAALLELNEIILKACESDPRRRYARATALTMDLALLERGRSVRGARKWKAMARAAMATIAIVLLVTALLLVKASMRSHAPSPEVKRLYDLGHHHHNQVNPDDFKKAVVFLNQALKIDPRYVPAYQDLFEIYIWTFPGVAATREEQLTKMREVADRLLAIDENLAAGHAALSYCKYLERDWIRAEVEIRRAIQLDPNYPMAHSVYGYYLSLQARTEEALRESQLGEQLDSASSRVAVLVAWFPYMAARQFDKAIEQLSHVIELDRNFQTALTWRGRCYEASSNYPAAIKDYESADLSSGEDLAKTKEFYDAWRQAFESRGERGYWEKKLEDLEPATSSGEERDSRQIAGCYAKLGERDNALDELEKHFDQMTVWNALKFEPMFDTLHDEPRFKALLRRAGLEKQQTGL